MYPVVHSRKEAQELGVKLYWGSPCRNGHGAPRYASCGKCVICHRELNAKRVVAAQEGDLAAVIAARWSQAKERERKSGIPMHLRVTKEEIWALPRPEYCPVFPWTKMEYKVSGNGTGNPNPGTASLDRIDNDNRSYSNGNARWVSNEANKAKREFGIKELTALYEDAQRCSLNKAERGSDGRKDS